MTSLSALFRSFFKIGLFTFGGGYAMIPLIEAEIINRRGWLLFGICFAGSVRKLNPILLILFSAVAGIAIYYVPTVV